MKHIKNLEKLLSTLIEQRTDLENRADWEAKEGSIGAASNLIDERDKLNECIESLEWVVEQQGQIKESAETYSRRAESADAKLKKGDELDKLEYERIFTQQIEYTRFLHVLNQFMK